MNKRNLLAETRGAIEDAGYTTDDVVWVGTQRPPQASPWAEAIRALDRDYDPGYGGAEIAEGLVVVMRDGTEALHNAIIYLDDHRHQGTRPTVDTGTIRALPAGSRRQGTKTRTGPSPGKAHNAGGT